MRNMFRWPPRQYLLPAIGLYLVCLVGLAPSMIVAAMVHHYSLGAVEMRQVEGHWWRGESQQVVLGRQPADQTGLGPLSWHWQVKALLHGQLAFDLVLAGSSSARFLVERTLAGWRLEVLQGDAGVASLKKIWPHLTINAKGGSRAGKP